MFGLLSARRAGLVCSRRTSSFRLDKILVDSCSLFIRGLSQVDRNLFAKVLCNLLQGKASSFGEEEVDDCACQQ